MDKTNRVLTWRRATIPAVRVSTAWRATVEYLARVDGRSLSDVVRAALRYFSQMTEAERRACYE